MVPPGVFTSLVLLRGKQGELEALRWVDSRTMQHVQPVIELDAGAKIPGGNLRAIADVVRGVSCLGRTALLDAGSLSAARRSDPVSLLDDIVERLSQPDLLNDWDAATIVPVARPDMTDATLRNMRRLCEHLTTGAALRMPEACSVEQVERLVRALGVGAADIDVIIDLAYVADADTSRVERVLTLSARLAELGRFRSTTILGGSVPKELNKEDSWCQVRFEERIWRAIRTGCAEDVRFGDYGVVHPTPSPDIHRSKHVSLKYTCATDEWLFLRERSERNEAPDEEHTESARAATLRSVCRSLVANGRFSGSEFSWGDRAMSHAARGGGTSLGSTSKPVAFATSHHLAFMAQHASG